jgi:hypothetical protein
MIDFDDLRRSGLPSFGALENALRFINTAQGRSGVYPSLPPTREPDSPPFSDPPRRRTIRRKKI